MGTLCSATTSSCCERTWQQLVHCLRAKTPWYSVFDNFVDRDERKRLTRSELVGNVSSVTEVSVVPPTRLRTAGIFVQQRTTIDRQVGYPVPAFNETVAEPMEYVQIHFWCCGHRDCEWVLTVGRDGCINEQLLRTGLVFPHAVTVSRTLACGMIRRMAGK